MVFGPGSLLVLARAEKEETEGALHSGKPKTFTYEKTMKQSHKI